jgi:enabled protein
MPVHESQKMPETPTSSAQPLSPIGSMPISRLGGAIAAADMSIVREAKPSIPGPAAFAGLKKTAGPRKGPPPPVPNKSGIISGQDMDPKLAAMLSKRRAWEPAEEEGAPSPPARTASAEARRLAKEDFDKGRKTGWKKDDE